MNKGMIFNIQKFSIHDGPGIRTTVFFKGCPLKCKWCSNPESQLQEIQILHDEKKCTKCGTCIATCFKNAISVKDDSIFINSNLCAGCLSCVNECPNEALSFEGERKTVEEIVDVCLQDIDFYEESGGGVTISGGEGMAQPEFLKSLVKELKANHIHVAIETTGYIEPEIFQELAPLFDLLLFDVKHYDSEKHYDGTFVHNEKIIQNLTWAIKHNICVLPRIPVIPGFNASLDDASGIANVLLEVGAKRVQLLPFHQFGEKKYDLLGRSYELKDRKALYPEDLSDYQNIFLDHGLDCFF